MENTNTTSLPEFIVFMRHGTRGRCTYAEEGKRRPRNDEEIRTDWRTYDDGLVNTTAVEESSKLLLDFFSKLTENNESHNKSNKKLDVRIISSPFRRCLETATVVATTMDCLNIDVALGLGEVGVHCKACPDIQLERFQNIVKKQNGNVSVDKIIDPEILPLLQKAYTDGEEESSFQDRNFSAVKNASDSNNKVIMLISHNWTMMDAPILLNRLIQDTSSQKDTSCQNICFSQEEIIVKNKYAASTIRSDYAGFSIWKHKNDSYKNVKCHKHFMDYM